jgi:hypothetical protein
MVMNGSDGQRTKCTRQRFVDPRGKLLGGKVVNKGADVNAVGGSQW